MYMWIGNLTVCGSKHALKVELCVNKNQLTSVVFSKANFSNTCTTILQMSHSVDLTSFTGTYTNKVNVTTHAHTHTRTHTHPHTHTHTHTHTHPHTHPHTHTHIHTHTHPHTHTSTHTHAHIHTHTHTHTHTHPHYEKLLVRVI